MEAPERTIVIRDGAPLVRLLLPPGGGLRAAVRDGLDLTYGDDAIVNQVLSCLDSGSDVALCQKLGLGPSAEHATSDANALRNSVGANAGGWRWWDSGEVTEELLPVLTRTVRRALGKAAAMEPQMRKVDPSPTAGRPGCWLTST
ncbi:hypothetical protein [Sphingomonas beigongshangi]|uniref:hypothetical protein n=1 Tax=Sphingomonas beigongshangi TaxID=2782540 RepID=UPI00193C3E07|nr:hypothetical protein [Sphingomonas beigongshangi]